MKSSACQSLGMKSSIKWISKRLRPESSIQDEPLSMHLTDDKSWNKAQNKKCTPIPNETSSMIDKIDPPDDQMSDIDNKHHFDDRNRQREIQQQRQHLHPSNLDDVENKNGSWYQEEEFSPIISTKSKDINYYGLQFIIDWLLLFSQGILKVPFDAVYDALLQGLQDEGKFEPATTVKNIVDLLNKVKSDTVGGKEKKRMSKLEDTCAYIYTGDTYVHRVVNGALRKNDRTKLTTLGPFCYILYNYIGRHLNDNRAFRHRFRAFFRLPNSGPITVYRGTTISDQTLRKYQQAAEDKTKYFKWLQFVSATTDEIVARL